MSLKINMHLLYNANKPDAAEQEEFANWLLKVEEEHIPTVDEMKCNIIQLSKDIILSFQDINTLIYFIYPNLSASSDSQYLVKYAILVSKNEHVNAINTAIMTQFPGKAIKYLSTDTIESQTDSNY
ncbi:441_t:CDS:1 [Cetraspora pellucida]|uniref:441_t:CDS:1 n=1 Tax=Cetraspora pellucida TaxID=1433469 RepID=A0A9N9GST1_9GLOM|nr:441_t:CDS:1 [Cetraspora pellucida]